MRGQQEVEAGGGARARARRHASAYWQRLKTVGSWAGPHRWAAQGGLGQHGERQVVSLLCFIFFFCFVLFNFVLPLF